MDTRAVSVDSPPDAAAVDSGVALVALDSRELRLLAFATGEHLPIELQQQLVELAARRVALAAG